MPESTGIIVLGPYRSGTSATAQVLHALGVNFGPKRHMIPAYDWNPGGHYERQDINDANDALIHSAGESLADPGDPLELAANGDKHAFELADMRWLEKSLIWGIKDPRLCASLLAWLEAGVLRRDNLKIIHVRRNISSAVRSALLCPPVRNFCDGSESGVQGMLEQYARLAQWHVDHLGIPTLSFDYERLIALPEAVVEELAEFIGITDPARIRKGVQRIGKGKGRFAMQMERYFIRGPRRILRMVFGRAKEGSLSSRQR